ncbi:tyrosine-type recombinase/integrase [Nocardia amamiensis]|uniref:tyrosine-type recombinase/integrase n=1 Tax=Nocardia amamiensis TaxID=404578 RepID=UPI0008312C26|nr:tyrosine-type recombinase/integrase [Nocardia amamiensis]
MTTVQPIANSNSSGTNLADRLRARFAQPVILVHPDDPVIGGPACLVPVCERQAVLLGKCSAHHRRWIDDGRPADVDAWAATAPANRRWLQQPTKCAIETCRRSRREKGLCHSHVSRWNDQGSPELTGWIADGGGGPPLPTGTRCRFPDCGLDAEGEAGLCDHHRSRWIRADRPPLQSWLISCSTFGQDRFDLRPLPIPMRHEIAYAIQCRVDERRTQTRPHQIRRLLRALPGGGVDSLLARTPESWTSYLGYSSERGYIERRFLLDAIGYLRDAIDGTGWDAEFPRDVWLLRRLGLPGRDAQFRFTGIEPIWLRQLTKRWARWRLSTGIVVGTVAADIRAITLFSQSFPALHRGPEALTRELVEVHLAYLANRFSNPKSRTSQISSLAGLLRATRQHGWEPRLAPQVDLFAEDYPRLIAGAPRALSEAVMAQLENPANLDRFANPRGRLLARILMSTGLRVGDGSRLRLDCIVRDGQGAPYLRYTNHKMHRDAFVPIDTDLAEAITAQQQAVLAEFDDPEYLLPRPTRNPEGKLPFSTATFRGELLEWLRACDIRDELGCPVHVSPHCWRHTFGTRLINNEVPQETVRRLLDHDSHAMTSHYARLSDKTIREQWERARKVNIAGEQLAPDTGPLAEAVWMKNNIARAKMALPNGYCALPLQQKCEFANACLTCPVFVTTPEFLPQHRRQLEQTQALIAQADHSGHQRLAEMNRTVEKNLLAIIDGLTTFGGCCSSGKSCTGDGDSHAC